MGITLKFIAAVAGCALAGGSMLHAASLSDAQQAARQGRADDALRIIAEVLKSSPNDAQSYSLRCVVAGTLERYDDAIAACETAARLAPRNSEYRLQLARAYGTKADHAGPIYGMRTVGKIRGAFEKAVELDPTNVDAMSDLGEFYVEAPGFVGGGTDKAQALVAKLMKLKPSRAHRLLGMIAAKDGDTAEAEREYQQELNLTHGAEAYVDLARFAMQQKNWTKASSYAVDAIRHDSKHAGDAVDAANLLVKMGRNLDAAHASYRAYFNSPAITAGLPPFYVHTLLAESLKKAGDHEGAQKEYGEALKLAPSYQRARRGSSS